MASQKPLVSNPKRIEIEERDQANNLIATYVKTTSEGVGRGERIDVIIPQNTTTYAKSIFYAFLPAGYPESVTGDYLEYQIYDSLQAFSSSIAGLLSSRAVLEGIGVGSTHTTPTSALLLSILQESMGRIATILFAHRLGTSLEPECKMYRLLADVFNDAAMVLDILSPAFPRSVRVGILGSSSVLRALCGVAAGSAKASLSAHFATQGNLGELNAKDSSQETIISLLGMLSGSLFVTYITTPLMTYLSMFILLFIHLGMNYLAVRAVSMRTLNRQRANLVFANMLGQMEDSGMRDGERVRGKWGKLRIPTPEEISRKERVFERDGVLRWEGTVLGYCEIGVSFQNLLSRSDTTEKTTGGFKGTLSSAATRLLEVFKDEDYVLLPAGMGGDRRESTLITLKESATTETQLMAWMHALWLAANQRSRGHEKDKVSMEELESTLAKVRTFMRANDVCGELRKKGWDLQTGALETRSGTRIKIS